MVSTRSVVRFRPTSPYLDHHELPLFGRDGDTSFIFTDETSEILETVGNGSRCMGGGLWVYDSFSSRPSLFPLHFLTYIMDFYSS